MQHTCQIVDQNLGRIIRQAQRQDETFAVAVGLHHAGPAGNVQIGLARNRLNRCFWVNIAGDLIDNRQQDSHKPQHHDTTGNSQQSNHLDADCFDSGVQRFFFVTHEIAIKLGEPVTEGDNDNAPVKIVPQTDIDAMEVLIVPHSWNGKRVDKFISSNASDDLSRARVQALVRQGMVTINGEVPRGTSSKISVGDAVRFAMPAPEEAIPQPEAIALDILFEDADLIVVNKPAGMVVHPAPGNWSGTLVNALLHHCKGTLSGIGGVKRPGIVHRLDKGTSGVMVVAKSYRAHLDLQEQFADHGRTGPLQRAYWALVWGAPPRMKGEIDAPLGRHPTRRLQRAVVDAEAADAKRALTHYQVQQRFNDPELVDDVLVSLVECRLETGRTHQIRVHMTHIGYPLLGDPEYGKQFSNRGKRLPPRAAGYFETFNRQALHARSLGFRHPTTGETVSFSAEPPEDMANLIAALRAGD